MNARFYHAGTVITAEHISQAWDLFLQLYHQQQPVANQDILQHLLQDIHNPSEWAAIRCSAAALAQVVAAVAPRRRFCQNMLPVLYALADEQRDVRTKYKYVAPVAILCSSMLTLVLLNDCRMPASATWSQSATAQQDFAHDWCADQVCTMLSA